VTGLQSRCEASSAEVKEGRQLLLVGGRDEGSTSSSAAVEVIDLGLQRSVRFPSLNVGRSGASVAVLDGDLAVVAGGWSDDAGGVVVEVEAMRLFESGRWVAFDHGPPTPRWHAAPIAVDSQTLLLVGGRDRSWQELSSIDVGVLDAGKLVWSRLSATMSQRRFAPAACRLDNTALVVVGGYNGSEWTRSCEVCRYKDSLQAAAFQAYPDLLAAIRFPKAVAHHSDGKTYIVVVGAGDEDGVIQLFDVDQHEWTLSWSIPSASVEACSISISNGILTVIGGSSKTSIHTVDLDLLLGPLAEAVPVDTGAFPPRPSFATAESTLTQAPAHSAVATASELGPPESVPCVPVSLRYYQSKMARFSGQVRSDSKVPHGQGVYEWADEKGHFHRLEEGRNSYYRGTFDKGYRDGIGEMVLVPEGRRYVGQLRRNAWSGLGYLEIGADFKYFGSFVKGKMEGFGRCTYVANGNLYEYTGYFENDRARGRGIIVDGSGGTVMEEGVFQGRDLTSGS